MNTTGKHVATHNGTLPVTAASHSVCVCVCYCSADLTLLLVFGFLCKNSFIFVKCLSLVSVI